MSKKLRKKSPKSSHGRKIGAKSAAEAKARPSRTRAGGARKSVGEAASAPLHKVPPKMLRGAKPSKLPGGKTNVQNPSALLEGAKAPSFRLRRDGGDNVALSDFSGKKLVLFFYPKADTPGCTREAMDFTRLASAFAKAGTAVLGISADSVNTQERFRDKHRLTVPLISDEKHEMLEAYGAWGEKSMYGRTFLGILRTTVLIGADGRIARIWRNVRVDGHADQVLEAARAL
jgi:thioredoxin-dependent peroxiredoxin